MRTWPALSSLKVGCVQYLNARPLICGFDGPVHFGHPSELARQLSAGELDIALVPVFEALRSPDCPIVDGVAIASDGPVFSVFLASKTPIEAVTRVALDPASLTSTNLLRCLFGNFLGMDPEYTTEPVNGDDARLLIGNQAIEFRHRECNAWRYYDLGEEWKSRTGLPFVFAVWLMRSNVADSAGAAQELRALKEIGRSRIDAICEAEPPGSRKFCREYLTRYIRYDLGERQKAGLCHFRENLIGRGQLPPSEIPLRFT